MKRWLTVVGLGVVGLGVVACGPGAVTMRVVEIDIVSVTEFPGTCSGPAWLYPDAPESDEPPCELADTGRVAYTYCGAARLDEEVPLLSNALPADEAVTLLVQLQYNGGDSFQQPSDAPYVSQTGFRDSALTETGQLDLSNGVDILSGMSTIPVSAAQNTSAILYEVDEGGAPTVVAANQLVSQTASELVFAYDDGEAAVTEVHTILSNGERDLTQRQLTSFECGCAQTKGAAPALVCLGLFWLMHRRNRDKSRWR